ncbi:hypothetical protein [Nostoc flagelliforme]|uniref:hypothetical protein n=1 Tax=Nostoc flagelliforme TaxID=1306274 RepID=UPI0016851A00|nr:hypothetical protein [Nostoc flagelliforme]
MSVSAPTEVQPEENYSSSLTPGEASADFMVKQHQEEQVSFSGRYRYRPAMLIAQTCNQDIYKPGLNATIIARQPGLRVLSTFGDLVWGY